MAYMNQEKKREIAPVVKAICKKYGVKASLAVRNHSTLVCNIKSGKLDFFKNEVDRVPARERAYEQVNTYWYHEHYAGKTKAFLGELIAAMNDGNHDRSDAQVDYFDVGWYVNVNVGAWDKDYEVIK